MTPEPQASRANDEPSPAVAGKGSSLPGAGTAKTATAAPPGGKVDQASVDSLLDQAQAALAGIDEPAAPLPPGVKPFEFTNLAGASPVNEPASLDLLRDVQLDLKIELGRTRMHLQDVLRLNEGAVVTLDKLAGDPVDIYANGRLIARGEVLVLNDNFCVRVAELISEENNGAA
ncbi:MAG TPA: flagellar motor switch protein FliN [Lacipirellulaceae bacterium]|jgi:flagellar motor switch protein FliN/FliY|nr:flagellar motor switch protein FliN [Lacipirellulaceae bacterium]